MSNNPLNSIFLEQRCDNALKTCNFAGATGEDCATEFCEGFPGTSGTCAQLGLDPQNCCGSDDPTSCLNNFVHNGGGGAAAKPNVCASVVSIIGECSSADPGLFPSNSIFTIGPAATSLAGCMCYDQNGTYDPELDGFASDCVASGSAAHPTYFTYGSLLNSFCTHNAGPATGSATLTNPGSAITTTALAAQDTPGPTSTDAVYTIPSQNVAATGFSTPSSVSPSTAVTTSNTELRSASQTSETPATTTTASSGSFKRSIPATSVFLLMAFSMLFSLY